MAARMPGVIALFDVDGTLTAPRKGITPRMLEVMQELRKGGNDNEIYESERTVGYTGYPLNGRHP